MAKRSMETKKNPGKNKNNMKILVVVVIIIAAAAFFAVYKPSLLAQNQAKNMTVEIPREQLQKRADISEASKGFAAISNGGRDPLRLSEITVSINNVPVECKWSVVNFLDVGNTANCEFISAACGKGDILKVSVPGSSIEEICK